MKHRILSLIAAMVLTLSTSAANIETDRSWYLAGEAMKVRITADGMIAYAELCDTYSMAAGVVVSLKDGEGEGVIQLPANLHSGYYALSVYTRHDPTVSRQLVAIVNPLRKSEDDDIEWVSITHPDSLSYPLEYSPSTLILPPSSIPVDVREAEGHIIKARVTSNQIRPSLSVVGKQIHYFEGKMVDDSTVVFYTYGIHGRQRLVLSAISATGESLPIEMISPFAALIPKELPHLVFHYKRSEVEARSLDMQRRTLVPTHPRTPEAPLDYDETVFGTKPYLTYNLDEYRQFRTVREVLLEYVSCVNKVKINGVQQLAIHTMDDSFDSRLPTLVLIDGIPVVDIEQLLRYDARRVHYINIYGNLYTLGNSVYNGILSFVTRSGQLTNYPTDPNMQYLEYDFPHE